VTATIRGALRTPLLRRVSSSKAVLYLAAVFSVLPLGFVWSVNPGFQTSDYYLPGYCYSTADYCDPDTHIYGIYVPGKVTTVSESPIRVFVVVAAVMLVLAAVTAGRGARRRFAWLAVAVLAVAIAESLARSIIVVVLLLIAAALAATAARRTST
jgi:hypothetical protein